MEGRATTVVLDRSQLRNVTLNDEALMREVLAALVTAATQQIEELRLAAQRADSKDCRRLAHVLTGACANVGAVSMARLLSSVEQQAVAGDFKLCQSSLEQLSAELEKLRREASKL
jgi:HPt (histidine-containing phosphotransfer) domain-containing protein